MTTFTQRELYGGAITVNLPRDYIDSSTLRQIPSHQELFLSPTTLTSVLVELNSMVPEPDISALQTNFTDPVVFPDTATINSTTPVAMALPSLSRFQAYLAAGEIASHERVRSAFPATLQRDIVTTIKTWLLLVRIVEKETDLCVRINVPMKEFDDTMAGREEGFVKEILARIVASLDVKDFGLFC